MFEARCRHWISRVGSAKIYISGLGCKKKYFYYPSENMEKVWLRMRIIKSGLLLLFLFIAIFVSKNKRETIKGNNAA